MPIPFSSFLQQIKVRVDACRAGHPLRGKATDPVGPLRGGSPAVAAAASSTVSCPGCGNETPEEIYHCHVCREGCCAECADTSDAPDYVVCKNCVDGRGAGDTGNHQAVPAVRSGILQPLRPAPPAEGLALGVLQRQAAAAATPAACPALVPAPVPVPALVPVLATPAAPVRDLAFFEGIARNPALSNREKWHATEAIAAIARGEEPAAFLSELEREGQCTALYHQLSDKATSDEEKWRIGEHLAKLEAGENPGAFIAGSVIDGRQAALAAALENETEGKEIWRLASQLDAVANGVPFISKAQRAKEAAAVEAQMKAATCPRERYRLAEKLNAI